MIHDIPSDHLILDRDSELETPVPDMDAKGALDKLRGLAFRAAVRMEEILKDRNVPDAAKLALVDIILDRVYGKPDEMLQIQSSEHEVEKASERIADLPQGCGICMAKHSNTREKTLEKPRTKPMKSTIRLKKGRPRM